jgi:hypothetical protein
MSTLDQAPPSSHDHDDHGDSHGHAGHGHHGPVTLWMILRQLPTFSRDHKIIGIQFLMTTLVMLMVGGALALGVRWQLAFPFQRMPILGDILFGSQAGIIAPETYTMLFTMHATVMIFLVIIPILAGAFGNFLIPLMIGADDMAFPTLFELHVRWRTGWWVDVLSPAERSADCRTWFRTCSNALVTCGDVRRVLVDDGFRQLYDDDHQHASTWNDLVPHAFDDLGNVYHRNSASFCIARSDGCWLHAGC